MSSLSFKASVDIEKMRVLTQYNNARTVSRLHLLRMLLLLLLPPSGNLFNALLYHSRPQTSGAPPPVCRFAARHAHFDAAGMRRLVSRRPVAQSAIAEDACVWRTTARRRQDRSIERHRGRHASCCSPQATRERIVFVDERRSAFHWSTSDKCNRQTTVELFVRAITQLATFQYVWTFE